MALSRAHTIKNLALALTCCACHGETVEHPGVEVTAPVPPSPPAAEPTAPDPSLGKDPCVMLAAGRSGVLALDEAGAQCDVIFGQPVEDAVQVDDNVLIAWSNDLAVYRIDMETRELLGQDTLTAPLPAGCDLERTWPETRLIVPLPQVGVGAGTMCFELANGSFEDLEDLRLVGTLDVQQLTSTFMVLWGTNPCQFPFPRGGVQCPRHDGRGATAQDSRFPYSFSDGTLVRSHDNRPPEAVWGPFEPVRVADEGPLDAVDLGIQSFRPAAVTSSGRYVVLAGNIRKGDVAHRELLLLDRATGDLFPIPSKPTDTWPAPLEVAQIGELGRMPIDTLTVVGESSFPPRPHQTLDLIAVGQLLLRPGRDVLRIPGRLVTRL